MRLKDHLNKLESFCAVVDSGSFLKASQQVYLGQPQLSKIVKQLEDSVGVPLLVRTAKGVTLTLEGEKLYEYAQKVLLLANETEFLLKSGGQKFSDTLRIGTYDSIARYFFPEFLKYMKAVAPKLKIQLVAARSAEVYSQLMLDQLDLAIIVHNVSLAKGIEKKKIYSDSFGFYCSPQISADFLNQVIYFPISHYEIEEQVKKLKFKEKMICDNLETVRALSEQGIGVGILPHRVARESLMSKKLIPYSVGRSLSASFGSHEIDLYYNKSLIRESKDFLVSEIERFLQLWSKM